MAIHLPDNAANNAAECADLCSAATCSSILTGFANGWGRTNLRSTIAEGTMMNVPITTGAQPGPRALLPE
jgi:hypothetical protein